MFGYFYFESKMIETITDITRGPYLFRVKNYLQQNKLIIGATRDPDSFPISTLMD